MPKQICSIILIIFLMFSCNLVIAVNYYFVVAQDGRGGYTSTLKMEAKDFILENILGIWVTKFK